MSWARRAKFAGYGLLGLLGLSLLGTAGLALWLRSEAGNRYLAGQLERTVDLSMREGDFQLGGLETDVESDALDRHLAVELGIVGQVDDALAAFAQDLANFEAIDMLGKAGGHWRLSGIARILASLSTAGRIT